MGEKMGILDLFKGKETEQNNVPETLQERIFDELLSRDFKLNFNIKKDKLGDWAFENSIEVLRGKK